MMNLPNVTGRICRFIHNNNSPGACIPPGLFIPERCFLKTDLYCVESGIFWLYFGAGIVRLTNIINGEERLLYSYQMQRHNHLQPKVKRIFIHCYMETSSRHILVEHLKR